MSNVIRIANTGIFYANSFDEVTFNANTIYGTNYVPNSQNFSGWNGPGNTYSISNTVPAPDGTFTATLAIPSTTNNYKGLSYGITFNSPGTLSLFVKPSGTYTFFSLSNGPNSTTYFNLSAGTTSGPGPGWASSSITPYPNGWYRLSVTQTSTQSWGTLYIQLENNSQSYTFAGDGVSGYYIWGAQLEINLTPTIYKPTNASGGPLYNTAQKIDSNSNVYIAGAYDEITFNPTSGVTKNIFKSSNNLSNGTYWAVNNVTVAPTNILAPDGTPSAFIITATGAGPYDEEYQYVPVNIGQLYTLSAYVKYGNLQYFSLVDEGSPAGTNIAFDLINNNIYSLGNGNVTGTMTPVGNGWYRCTMSFVISSGLATAQSTASPKPWLGLYNSNTYTGYTYIWGLQLEQNSVATIYEPTNTLGLPSQNSIIKVENTGNTYTIGNYDEWTGIVPTTNGLILNLDGAFPQSYSGTGLNINDLTGNPNNLFSGNAGSMPLYNPNYGSFYCDGIKYKTISFYYTVPSIFYTNAFSLEVWIKPKIFNTLGSSGADSNIISIIENYGVNGFRFGLQTLNNLTTDTTAAPIFFCNESGGTLNINALNSSLFPITIGKWSQIVVTYDGVNTGNMYVNGNFLLSSTGTYKPIASSSGGFFGGPAEGTNPMVGEFNSMKWYNRAITAQEVLANFNGLRNRYGI
jgi:hypothetical protein